jgi:zinc protease
LRAGEDTWERYERALPDYGKVAAEELDFRRAEDDFDRSILPPAGANPVITLPEIWRGELDNGIAVLGARNVETPTTSIRLRIAAGQRHESVEQLGLAALTASMMDEATELSSNEELSDRLQKLGSSIRFRASNSAVTATVRSLTRNLDETLAILAEKLLEPKFDPTDFARLQAQTLQAIETSKKEASPTASMVYQLVLFGHDNPIAYRDIGTSASVQQLTVDDVRTFYEARYSPAVASIVAVSDLSQAELLPKLASIEGWQGPAAARTPLKSFPDTGKTKLYVVDKPGAAQSEIRIGKPSLAYDATGEYYRAGLGNFVLGGAFNSRVNLNLREDKGYTYGAFTRFGGDHDYGTFTAQAGVRTDATAASIVEFEQEIRGYAESGITADELAFTRSAIGQRDARSYETPFQKLNFLSRILIYDLADDFVDVQNQILKEIPAEEINALMAKHLTMDDMVIVVVGDWATIKGDLAGLGYDIVHLDAGGNPQEPEVEA